MKKQNKYIFSRNHVSLISFIMTLVIHSNIWQNLKKCHLRLDFRTKYQRGQGWSITYLWPWRRNILLQCIKASCFFILFKSLKYQIKFNQEMRRELINFTFIGNLRYLRNSPSPPGYLKYLDNLNFNTIIERNQDSFEEELNLGLG